ncbi:MAG: PDZ domain-containing protein, partial [Planctomycetota bacterium]
AGLREGEIVTSVDGRPVADVAAFTRQLVLREPGEPITFLVRGRSQPVRVVLGAQEEARRRLPTPDEFGFEAVPLSPGLRRWLGVKDAEQGVAVEAVRENGPAAKGGLKRGDVILEGDGNPTRDVEELLAALAGAR